MANGNGDDEKTIAGVFSSRIVGGLFALAFGAWAIVLGSIKSDIIQNQTEMQKELVDIKAEVVRHQVFSAQKTAEFDANIRDYNRRIESLERTHRNGSKHTQDD